jgi:hypothetical protein
MMKKLYFFIVLTTLFLSNKVNAYIPDRCDWLDCGSSEGASGIAIIIFIVIVIIMFKAKTKK